MTYLILTQIKTVGDSLDAEPPVIVGGEVKNHIMVKIIIRGENAVQRPLAVDSAVNIHAGKQSLQLIPANMLNLSHDYMIVSPQNYRLDSN